METETEPHQHFEPQLSGAEPASLQFASVFVEFPKVEDLRFALREQRRGQRCHLLLLLGLLSGLGPRFICGYQFHT